MKSILSGQQVDFVGMLHELVELEFDAIEAYKTAIDRVVDEDFKSLLIRFNEQHERHVVEINHILIARGVEAVKGPTGKRWVIKGEVMLGQAIDNDKGILKVMFYIEEDTNKGYETLCQYKIWEEAVEILEQGLKDEQGHKRWLEEILDNWNDAE